MTSPEPRQGSLSADAVAAQSFAVVRRGYDTREVQSFLRELADELRALRQSLADHQTMLGEARAAAEEAATFDEQRLTEALGAETVRILDAARAAAEDLRARGRAEGDALLAAATDEAEQIRRRAESVLEERRAEADAEVAGRLAEAAATLEQAQAEADALRRQGVDDAAGAVEEARTQGRAMVAEAHQVRERMLRDLTKRRKALRAQIEQLHAGRDRLLEAYQVVRTTLDTATGELEVVLPEARSAAAAASARVAVESAEDAIDPDLLAELADGGVAPPSAVVPSATDHESTTEPPEEPLDAAPQDEPEDTEVAPAAESVPEGAPTSEAELAPSADEPAPEVVADTESADVPPTETAEATPAPDEESAAEVESAADAVAALEEESAPEADPAVGAAADGSEEASIAATEGDRHGTTPGEGSIFSRPAPRLAPDPVEHTGRFSSAVTVLAPSDDETAADESADDETADDVSPAATEAVPGSADPTSDPASIFARLRAEADQPEPEPDQPEQAEADQPEPEPDQPAQAESAQAESDEAHADKAGSDDEAAGEAPAAAAATRPDDGVAEDEPSPDTPLVGEADSAPENPETPEADVPDDAAELTGDTPEGEPIPEVVAQRDDALTDVRATLSRRLKRTLADEQNEVLEVLRRRRGKVDLAQLLVDHDAHVSRYADASLPALATAAAAGADQIRARHPEVVEDVPRTRVGDVAEDLAIEVVVPLRRRVEEAIVAHPGDETAIGDAVRLAYRDVKQRLVDDAAALATARVFCRAHSQPVRAGTPMVWLAAPGGPRSAGCQANAEATPVPHGEPFPDPSVEPPCSAECRCMVVPAAEIAAPVG
ncbi:MAG: DivIVA domain-containing protein [Acidimicrobiia bacterium]|nr:DivIVA domain-containing protein [Acidimicrobiia bacterium]